MVSIVSNYVVSNKAVNVIMLMIIIMPDINEFIIIRFHQSSTE